MLNKKILLLIGLILLIGFTLASPSIIYNDSTTPNANILQGTIRKGAGIPIGGLIERVMEAKGTPIERDLTPEEYKMIKYYNENIYRKG